MQPAQDRRPGRKWSLSVDLCGCGLQDELGYLSDAAHICVRSDVALAADSITFMFGASRSVARMGEDRKLASSLLKYGIPRFTAYQTLLDGLEIIPREP